MQNYVNRIVIEWKNCYEDLPEPTGDAWNKMRKLPELTDLRKGVLLDSRNGDAPSKFKTQYLDKYEAALNLMRRDIFGPDKQNGSQPDLDTGPLL